MQSFIIMTIRMLLLAIIIFFYSLVKFWSHNSFAQSGIKTIDLPSMQDSLDYYYNLGDNYFYQGYYVEANRNYLKYFTLLHKYFPDDKIKLADIYITLGVINSKFWNFDKALQLYNKAEILCKNNDYFNEQLGRIFYSKGKIYKRTGEYEKAIQYYRSAFNIFESEIISGNNNKELFNSIIYVNNSLGVLYYEQKYYKESLNFFIKCEKLSRTYYKEFLPVTYENIANCYYKMKVYNEAENYFELAVKYHLTSKRHLYKYLLANLYSSYSQLCLETGKYEKAYDLLQKAYGIYISHWGTNHPHTSDCLINFGKYFEKTGNTDSALFYYQKSIIALAEDFDNSNIYSNPEPGKAISVLHLINSLKHKAQALSNYYNKTGKIKDLETSLGTFDLAIQHIDNIRLGYQTQESKLFLSENEKATYTSAIHTAYRLWNITDDKYYIYKAFEYAEKSKAAVLLAALRTTEAKSFAGIPDTLLLKENNLLKNMALYKELIYEEKRNEKPDEGKIENWEQKLFNLNGEYDDLTALFEDSFPRYYYLKYNTQVVNIYQLQNSLITKDALIEYILTDTILYTFMVTQNKVKLIAQPADTTFHNNIEYIIYFLQNQYSECHMEYSQVALSLYNKLIKPFEKLIKNKNLIIIPDGNLGYIAFESLLYTSLNNEYTDYSLYPYLIKKHPISYVYSSTLYKHFKYKNRRIKNKFLAVAPGYKNSNETLTCLPFTVNEAKLLAKITKGKALYENKATERNFKSKLDKYNIIHLTMHAIVDDIEPMYSKLVFTNDKDTSEDGFLHVYEIYNMNLDADLVVLSACNTGNGILHKGEGILSIARGFFHAGSKSIIMSLWQAGDKTSFRILLDFYKYLLKGKRKDYALCQAKLKYLEYTSPSKAHPSFWAGYVLLGNTARIYNKSTFLICFLISGVILIIFLFNLRWLINKYKKARI